MQALRSLIWTIFWPFAIIFLAGKSSLISLSLGIIATFFGIGIALIIPEKMQLFYIFAVYLTGALFFWPLVNSKKNHVISMLINLILCGLLVGSGLVNIYKSF